MFGRISIACPAGRQNLVVVGTATVTPPYMSGASISCNVGSVRLIIPIGKSESISLGLFSIVSPIAYISILSLGHPLLYVFTSSKSITSSFGNFNIFLLPLGRPTQSSFGTVIATGGNQVLSIDGDGLIVEFGVPTILNIFDHSVSYRTDANGGWSFVQYGDKIIASNYKDPIQVYNLGEIGASFSPLGGNPPKARWLSVVKNFLVAVNIVDEDGISPQRVRWSGLDSPTSWTPSLVTQADFQDLFGDGGENQGIVAGLTQADAMIIQERSMWKMTYTGPPLGFQFDKLEGIRGTPAPGSLVSIGGLVYYLGEDGFYVFDGSQSSPIGNGKINNTFFDDVDHSYFRRISSVPDITKKLIYWSYPDTSATSGIPNKILVFDWGTGEWTRLEIETEILWRTLSFGYTLEELDQFGTIDTLVNSLDSRQWTGGIYQLSAFNANHKTAHFTGSPLGATITSQEITIPDPKRMLVVQVWPRVRAAAGNIRVGVGRRTLPSDSVSFAASTTMNSVGFCPQRVTDNYLRFRMSLSAGAAWSQATGIDIVSVVEGNR